MISLGVDINIRSSDLLYTVQANTNRMANHRGILRFNGVQELSLSLMSLINYYPLDIIVCAKSDAEIVRMSIYDAFGDKYYPPLTSVHVSKNWEHEMMMLGSRYDITLFTIADKLALDGALHNWFIKHESL